MNLKIGLFICLFVCLVYGFIILLVLFIYLFSGLSMRYLTPKECMFNLNTNSKLPTRNLPMK